MKRPSSRTSRNAASSLWISGPYSALTSTSGIVCMLRHLSCGPPPVHEIRREEQYACNDRIFHVMERVVEPLVAGAEPVARADEGERPERRSDESQAEERSQWHLEDAGRNRDERAKNGSQRPDQHARLVPAAEPRVGAIEPLRRHVQPAAAPLEQLPAPEASDRPTDDGAGEVAEGRSERKRDHCASTDADVSAEDHDARSREDTSCDGAADEGDELASDRQDGTQREQPEDGV